MAETFELRGWPGGLNLASAPALVNPDELVKADNIDLGDRGELKLRQGAAVLNPANDIEDLTFDWIWSWWSPNQSSPTLVLFDDDTDRIWWVETGGVELDPTTFDNNGAMVAPTFSYGYFPQGIVMNGLAYVTRCAWAGASNFASYELDLAANNAASLTPWAAASDQTAQFPRAGALCVAYDRVFAANLMTSSTARQPNRLFFSDQLLPKSWKVANFIDVGPDDGQVITAIRYIGDQIVIWKEMSVWAIAGSDFTGLGVELYKLDDDIGCTAPGTIVDVGTATMFLDPAKGVFLYDGSEFHDVGKKIYPFIRTLIDSGDADVERMWAWHYKDSYYLHVRCDDPSLEGTFVYNIKLGAWTFHTLHPFATTHYVVDGTTIVNAVGADVGIWTLHSGYTDPDGTQVQGEAHTAWISPGSNALQHRSHGVEATVLTQGQGVSVAVAKDYEGFHYAHQNFPPNESAEDGTYLVRSHMGGNVRWRALQLRIALWTDQPPWL